MDAFILSLPEYSATGRNPRPRPLSYGDFQLLVSPEGISALQEIDRDDLGLADIWLTHAFQGGRISETLKLRLGCVGLVGSAQPYIWRDISKVHVVDYGMPCHLPVYERLLRRQQATAGKLRARYADQLAALDDRGRAQLEADGIASMPLFPGALQEPRSSHRGIANPIFATSSDPLVEFTWAVRDHDTPNSGNARHLTVEQRRTGRARSPTARTLLRGSRWRTTRTTTTTVSPVTCSRSGQPVQVWTNPAPSCYVRPT